MIPQHVAHRVPSPEPLRQRDPETSQECSRAMLSAGYLDALASDVEPLMKQLSGAKQGELDRQHLMGLFNRGLLFLNAVLDGIDEGKLRTG
jgi:hypothetical protein